MIPIGDSRIVNAPPRPVTILLIILNIGIFLYQYFSLPPEEADALTMNFAAVPAELASGHHLLSLITYQFLHGGWLHLLGNMLFLYIFGDNVEAALGSMGFLLFYLAAGAVGAVAHIILTPFTQVPLVGASGAISGCMGAYLFMFPRSRVKVFFPVFIIIGFTFRVSAWLFLLVWIGLQVWSNSADDPEESGIAYTAHVAGFAVGMLVGLMYRGRAARFQMED